jgi:hypothetical protein
MDAQEKAEIYALTLWNIAADLDWTAGELWDRLAVAKRERLEKLDSTYCHVVTDLEIPD